MTTKEITIMENVLKSFAFGILTALFLGKVVHKFSSPSYP